MASATARVERDREFSFHDKEFNVLRDIVRSQTGIALGDHKKEMVYGRLARRLRALGLTSFTQYCDLIGSNNGDEELSMLVNAITTNLTKFFREDHHFKHLSQHLRSLVSDPARRKKGNRLRIWSAGCSSGEEPYSIAMTVADSINNIKAWDARILATDLDTNMLARGMNAEYPVNAVDNIPDNYKKRMMGRSEKNSNMFRINEPLRELVSFKQLNLLSNWPHRQKYDVIFCRNVLIYFDAATTDDLVDRFIDLLDIGGILYLGHSESLLDNSRGLQLIGQTAYRKVEER